MLPLDIISSLEAIQEVVGEAGRKWGKTDVLVNNAAINAVDLMCQRSKDDR